MFIRTVKVPSSNGTVNEYVRVVEAYRDDGKVKQRVIADLGRKDRPDRPAAQARNAFCSARPRRPVKIPMPSTSSMPPPGGPSWPSAPSSTQLGLWRIFDELAAPVQEGTVPMPIASSCCWPIG